MDWETVQHNVLSIVITRRSNTAPWDMTPTTASGEPSALRKPLVIMETSAQPYAHKCVGPIKSTATMATVQRDVTMETPAVIPFMLMEMVQNANLDVMLTVTRKLK